MNGKHVLVNLTKEVLGVTSLFLKKFSEMLPLLMAARPLSHHSAHKLDWHPLSHHSAHKLDCKRSKTGGVDGGEIII